MFRIINGSIDKNSKEYKEFRRKANERNRKYYAKPEVKERKKQYKKEYDGKNKKRISEYGYKLRAKSETQLRLKKWRKENREYIKLYNKKYIGRKRELDREYSKKKWKDPIFRQREIERQIKFRKEYPEIVKKSKRKYNQSPKGKLTITKYVHKRLAKIHGNWFDLTKEQIKEIWDRDKTCVYCNSNKKLSLDHIIPLSKNGETTFDNIVISCMTCNASKGDKDVIEWCKLQGRKTPEIVLNNLKAMNYKL